MIILLLLMNIIISYSLGNQLEMTRDENLLLYYHNYIRRERNTCDYHTSIPADVKLNDYVWDYGLHITAQRYAKQCECYPSSMQSRTTCRWKSVGQNIAQVNSVQNAIEQWRNEQRFYDFTTDSCERNHNCHVYKQIVNSNTTHIGCAIQLCIHSMNTGKYLIVCNYAPAAGEGRPYDDARKSRCKQ
ncbi:GLIPR1-like protein [Schistosoma japonicum]|uniref:GLIPR1-like protein n=1 Tax=Schistosoma japonicum TaxID=6182 RepID=A0A4Z2CLE1_SCHJA|nr:GLIPR1-like protein [Schistosoma japonicum]